MPTTSAFALSALLLGVSPDPEVPPGGVNRLVMQVELTTFYRAAGDGALGFGVPRQTPALNIAVEREVGPGLFMVGMGGGGLSTAPTMVRDGDRFKKATRAAAGGAVSGGVRGVFARVGPVAAGLQGAVGFGGSWSESLKEPADFFTGAFGDVLLTAALTGTATAIIDVALMPAVALRFSTDLLETRLTGTLVQAPADVAFSVQALDAARVGAVIAI